MITKFIIPVMDTESGKYDYDGDLSQEEYFGMIRDKVNRTSGMMDSFVNSFQNGVINRGYSNAYDLENVKDEEIKYNYSEAEALIEDVNNEDVDEVVLHDFMKSGKKFILKVNINPESLESDAESEIRYWMDDSDMVLTDNTLDKKTKILSLPQRNFILDLATDENPNGEIFQLLGCKILQIYPQEQTKCPFYLAIMVEKIILQ